MEGLGVYLYCFARAGGPTNIAARAVDGRNRVDMLQRDGVAAVFSRVTLNDFAGEAGERNLRDPAWLVPRACRHESVIEEVMRTSPVLPVRFGAVFSSAEVLAELLAARREEIARFLDRMSGVEEWAVKGYVEVKKAVAHRLESDPTLAEARSRLPRAQGARYFAEKRLQARAQQVLKSWCHAAADEIQGALRREAVDVCPLKLQPDDRSPADLRMVFNCAYLLRRDRLGAFRSLVRSVEASFADQGLTLAVSGPWPPNSFCPVMGGTLP